MKKNTGNRQSQSHRNTHTDTPQAGNGESVAAVMDTESETAHKVVSMRPAKGVRKSIFDMDLQPVSEATGNKLMVVQEATQQLAHAKDLWAEGEGRAEEATEIAGKASLLLTTALLSGNIKREEVSAKLGDVFGYKPNADGKPGKTPLGQGEAIRKRIVRLAAAQEFISNGEASDGFFKGLTPTSKATITVKDGRKIEVTVKEAFDLINKGEIGFWAGYEAFAAIKRAAQVPVPLAYNANRIAEITAVLQQPDAPALFVKNMALRKAYAGLFAIIGVVAEEAANVAEAEAKAA